MIAVTWWYDVENDRWNAAVDDQPEVNSTGRTPEEMRSLLVGAFNRVNGTSLTEADFEFVETTT